MRPARWLTALVAGLIVLPATLSAVPSSAAAKPAPGLCAMNTSRGAVPANFAIDACVTAAGIWLRNQLQVPVRFKSSGDAAQPVNVHTDVGLAALATRTVYPHPLILLPGDVVRIPVGAGKASAKLSGTDAGGFYAMAVTVATFLPGATQAGTVINAFTSLIKELADASFEYQNCLVGKNWLGQQGCQIARVGKVTWAVGKAAVVIGFRSAPVVSLVLNAATYLDFLNAQVPGVEAVLSSERTITLAARRPATPPPPPRPAGPACPGASTFLQVAQTEPNWRENNFSTFELVKGPKCASGWAAAFGILDYPLRPAGVTAYEWMVIKHTDGRWRIHAGSGAESATDRPRYETGICTGPPAEIVAWLDCVWGNR
jgi:hypothetical protein